MILDDTGGSIGGGVNKASSTLDDNRLRLADVEIGMELSRVDEKIGDSIISISSEACRLRLPWLASDGGGMEGVGRGDASAIVERISTRELDGDDMLVGVLHEVSWGEVHLVQLPTLAT